MKKYYLAYGSNLNIAEMKQRCPFAIAIGKTTINNYRLVFKGIKQLGYLTIEPCEGSVVPVGVYEITPMDEANLDYYECVPTLYTKHTITVLLNNQPIEAIVYIMNPFYTYNPPTASYISRCLQGYKDFNISSNYLNEALKNTKLNIPKSVVKRKSIQI